MLLPTVNLISSGPPWANAPAAPAAPSSTDIKHSCFVPCILLSPISWAADSNDFHTFLSSTNHDDLVRRRWWLWWPPGRSHYSDRSRPGARWWCSVGNQFLAYATHPIQLADLAAFGFLDRLI